MRVRTAALVVLGALALTGLPASADVSGDPSRAIDFEVAASLARADLELPDKAARGRMPDAVGVRRPAAAAPVGDAGAVRHSGIGTDYVDVCGDSSSRNDVRHLFVAEDTSYGAMYFGAGMCAPVSLAELVAGAVEFYLWSGETDHPDYTVILDADTAANPRITVLYTPSQDPATWQMTHQGPGIVLDDGFEIGGAIPFRALHDRYQFAFGVTVWSSGTTATDHVPELDADILIYPYTCNIEVWTRAAVTPKPGQALQVRAALAAAGYPIVGDGETFDVVGVADLDELRHIPGIAWLGRPATAIRQAVPSDPDWTGQWQYAAIGAPEAWRTTASSGVTIAIVDDGVDARRSDLAGRVVAGWDSNSGKQIPAGRNSDLGGHGTAIAGFAAGSGTNGRELLGVDWGARVAPFRVFDASGCGTSTSVADGVRRAADSGAKIINLSVGFTSNEPPFADAVAYAISRGALVVAAVGNDARSGGASYPASYPGVLGVGASTRSSGVAFFSNRGTYVDLVAPGGDGSGTAEGDLLGLADRGIEAMAGTSFSAPLAAGAAALYLGLHPGTSAGALTSLLTSTARDIGPAGRDDASGHGILNVAALIVADPPAAAATSGFDGDPTTTERLDTTDAFRASAGVSTQRFGDDDAAHVVLARHDAFADALSGSSLTGDGPLLYSFTDRIPDFVVAEMSRVLPPGGRVYLLGGPAALSETVVDQVRAAGLSPRRLHGPTRFETSAAVATETLALYPNADKVLIARGDGAGTAAWADAIAGGGYAASARVPVLLSPSAALAPVGARWLDARPKLGRILLGGPVALSAEVEQRAGGTRHRVAGPDRYATAIAIADQLWKTPRTGERRFVIVNSYRTDGWFFGLVGAGFSADSGAPILAVGDTTPLPKVVLDRVASCRSAQVDLVLLGSRAVILDNVAGDLDRQDPRPC